MTSADRRDTADPFNSQDNEKAICNEVYCVIFLICCSVQLRLQTTRDENACKPGQTGPSALDVHSSNPRLAATKSG